MRLPNLTHKGFSCYLYPLENSLFFATANEVCMTQEPMTPKRHPHAARNKRSLESEESLRYAAYARREEDAGEEPAFAPPPDLHAYAQADEPEAQESLSGNVYHPREAIWAEERRDALLQSELGYQVHPEEQPAPKKRRRRRHPLRAALLSMLALCLLAGAGIVAYQPVREWLRSAGGVATETPFAVVVTPEPVRAYDAAPEVEIPDSVRLAIANLSGTLQMDPCIVTQTHVVMRHQRDVEHYDFYLYSVPEGRLLCYFEGLGKNDMIPQEDGTFFVSQAPYLVASNGSALLRLNALEEQLGRPLRLHPLLHGWAVAEAGDELNYVNRAGQTLSQLWFSRAFPFTGAYTLAYVDTGSTADADQRYLLYVLGEDGSMTRWRSAAHTDDVVAAACGMAYLRGGELYRLPDVDTPLLHTSAVDAYVDCDALVVRDPQSGKYGLMVHGEQHYDFVYDSISPMESDIQWSEATLEGGGCRFTVHAVEGMYPLPLSYSFVLEREGRKEYVALSAQSAYPVRLDGEFETEEPV